MTGSAARPASITRAAAPATTAAAALVPANRPCTELVKLAGATRSGRTRPSFDGPRELYPATVPSAAGSIAPTARTPGWAESTTETAALPALDVNEAMPDP